MLTIVAVYTPKNNDTALADHNIDAWYDDIKMNGSNNMRVQFGSENMFHRLRVGHINKEIHIKEVVFEDHNMKVNEDGRLEDWPKGFCDRTDIYLSQLLGWQ